MGKYPYIDKLLEGKQFEELKREMSSTIKIIRDYSNQLHTIFSKRASKVINHEKEKLKYIESKLTQIK